MEFIKSIQIRKFRSLKSVTKNLELSSLNIFVGQNDQGKSNLLKALNLFFNNETDVDTRFRFEQDYCFHSNTGKGTSNEIRIDLVIEPPKQRFKYAKPLRWVKRWKKDGSVVEERKYIGTGKVLSQTDNVSKWLDKIRYRYIPAIKGQSYFISLMGELHDVLNEAHADLLSAQGEGFIGGIQKITENITRDLIDQIGISNSIQVPSDFKLLFSNLDFGVKLNGNTYHLKHRGDGIKIRHIPIILKYMSEQERNISRKGYVKPDTIWGFEEPENNLELTYAFELAETFKKYSDDIQILVTTHSPAFYALDKNDSDGVSTFYISRGVDECSSIRKITHEDAGDIHESMGLLPLITPYLERIFEHQQEIENLKSKAEGLAENIKNVILTEDENFENVKRYFQDHGCNLDESEFISYLGADQINGAILIGGYLSNKHTDLLVIIHRDRDYLCDKTIETLKKKVNKKGFHLFITSGVDMESQFLCPLHINQLYPQITIEKANDFLLKATKSAKDESFSRLVDHTFKQSKPANDGFYKRWKELELLYDSDINRYRYGKKVMGHLIGLLQSELGENPNLYRITQHIESASLKEIFR